METDRIKRIFFPRKCSVCGKLIPIECDYCSCSGDRFVEPDLNVCEHCGQKICSCDNDFSAVLSHITAPFVYCDLAKQRLRFFKFQGEKKEAEFFGEKMSLRFSKLFFGSKPDFVTFVPMTRESERIRGYNQSRLLALEVSKRLFIPCEDVLVKTKETVSQHKLSQKERALNLKNTFEVFDKSKVFGKTIILCDDIKTTGTTLKRCEDELLKSGAKDVFCLCAAVADFSNDF